MNNKNISIVLFLIAGLILIGLLSRWNFDTWRFVDGIIVLVVAFLGIILIKKDEFKFKNILIVFKSRKFWVIVIVLIILTILSFIGISLLNKMQKEKLKCKFNLTNIVENRYQEDKNWEYITCDDSDLWGRLNGCENGHKYISAKHYTYWEIDGMLKNESRKEQYLKSIILKIYTNDERKILLAKTFLDIKENLTSGQSYPFQVRAQIDRDSEIGKYFNKDAEVKIDMYPYFSSCSY